MTTIFTLLRDIIQIKSGNLTKNADFGTVCSPYLLQRWLSMDSPNTAHLVNETTNKLWNAFEDDREMWYKFYLTFINQNQYRNIFYIKKASKNKVVETEETEVERLARKHSISKREVEEYLSLLNILEENKEQAKVDQK